MRLPLFLTCMTLISACTPQLAPLPSSTPPAPAGTSPVPPTATFTATLPPVALTSPVIPTVTASPTLTPTPAPAVVTVTLVPPLTATPGLVLRGHIRLADGTGLGNVTVCRNYASYPGVVVATTDPNGYFESTFAFIPGDEMVGVWPLAAGYNFDPPYYRWRHYYGPEDRTLDFVASPASATAVPPGPCP